MVIPAIVSFVEVVFSDLSQSHKNWPLVPEMFIFTRSEAGSMAVVEVEEEKSVFVSGTGHPSP